MFRRGRGLDGINVYPVFIVLEKQDRRHSLHTSAQHSKYRLFIEIVEKNKTKQTHSNS